MRFKRYSCHYAAAMDFRPWRCDMEPMADAFQDQLATKSDLLLLEQRLTIKVGGMLVVAIGLLAAILKGLP